MVGLYSGYYLDRPFDCFTKGRFYHHYFYLMVWLSHRLPIFSVSKVSFFLEKFAHRSDSFWAFQSRPLFIVFLCFKENFEVGGTLKVT